MAQSTNYIILIPRTKLVKQLKGILPKPAKAISCENMNKVIQDCKIMGSN